MKKRVLRAACFICIAAAIGMFSVPYIESSVWARVTAGFLFGWFYYDVEKRILGAW